MTAISLIPEKAPFNDEQRAWLNGFLSGLMGAATETSSEKAVESQGRLGIKSADAEEDLNEAPWHDSALPIVDRMKLAEGKPLGHRLMAAMAQLDCGSCGYLCKTYSAAIASGQESNMTLCSPGGKETKQALKQLMKETAGGNGGPSHTSASDKTADEKTVGNKSPAAQNGSSKNWTRQNPFTAKLVESLPLNKAGSVKDTRHVVIDLQSSGLKYEVGDALGIYPTNCSELAQAIVQRLAAEPHTMVAGPAGAHKSLVDLLCDDVCLKDPADELLELLRDRIDNASSQASLQKMLDEGVPEGFDVLDALDVASDAKITATEFVETLSPLNPRLYSIASSMREVGEQVHLTVGKVAFEREGRRRKGAASCMLAERLPVGAALRVFVQPNHGGFTVPADPNTPMIMVGPGTGIAPFMAFLQERARRQARGGNWLFFGDQHAATDFLYEDQLTHYRASGLLTRLDTAFSRDGQTKTYVQDRMRENAAELWRWLEAGAHLYICGDASRMAADVERELKSIASSIGQLGDEQAVVFLKGLAAEKRYVKDVY